MSNLFYLTQSLRGSRQKDALRKQLILSYKNKVFAMNAEQRAAEKQSLAQAIKAFGGVVDLATRIRVELFLEVENDCF